jgi:hypothetical protein
MIRSIIRLLVAGATITASTQGNSAETALPFSGAVLSTCVLTVSAPGVIAPNATYDQLSSENAGGISGTVAAVTTDTLFQVSADAPTNFTAAPAGGDTGVKFAATYQGSGATSIGVTPGTTQTQLNPGTTMLEIDLLASRSSGTFPTGDYATEVTVRCE